MATKPLRFAIALPSILLSIFGAELAKSQNWSVLKPQQVQAAQNPLGATDCIQKYKHWKTLPSFKAFTYTAGNYRNQACGESWGWPSKKQAIKAALEQCKLGAVHFYVPKSACRLLDVK